MRSRLRQLLLAPALAATLVAGCGDASESSRSDDATGHEHLHPDAGELEQAVTPCGDQYPPLQVGMVVEQDMLRVRLREASLVPARQQRDNRWQLELLDADGTPSRSAVLVRALAYMPVHRHYGTPDPRVVAGSELASFTLERLRFRMRGPWDVTLYVERDGQTLMPTFRLCVE